MLVKKFFAFGKNTPFYSEFNIYRCLVITIINYVLNVSYLINHLNILLHNFLVQVLRVLVKFEFFPISFSARSGQILHI